MAEAPGAQAAPKQPLVKPAINTSSARASPCARVKNGEGEDAECERFYHRENSVNHRLSSSVVPFRDLVLCTPLNGTAKQGGAARC